MNRNIEPHANQLQEKTFITFSVSILKKLSQGVSNIETKPFWGIPKQGIPDYTSTVTSVLSFANQV
jgi:hypothetical protein